MPVVHLLYCSWKYEWVCTFCMMHYFHLLSRMIRLGSSRACFWCLVYWQFSYQQQSTASNRSTEVLRAHKLLMVIHCWHFVLQFGLQTSSGRMSGVIGHLCEQNYQDCTLLFSVVPLAYMDLACSRTDLHLMSAQGSKGRVTCWAWQGQVNNQSPG